MKQFLESLIKSIVENPDKVTINESQDDKSRYFFSISVDPGDMGRVIGKSGNVINAIRTIMRVVAIRQGVKISVDIQDQGQPTQPAAAETDQPTQDQSPSNLVQTPDQPDQPQDQTPTPAEPSADQPKDQQPPTDKAPTATPEPKKDL